MKHRFSLVLLILLSGVLQNVLAQNEFRTRQTGDWNNSDTWEEEDNPIGNPGVFNNTGNTPTSADGVITVRNTHTVTVTASVTIDEATIESGGAVDIQEFNTLTIADGSGSDLTVNGTLTLLDDFFFDGSALTVDGQLINTGTITINDPNLSTVDFNANSTYEHNQSGGSIPDATWNSSSTVSIDVGSTSSPPSNLDQTFGNFTWNSSSQSGTVNLALSGSSTVIQGDFTVTSSNSRVLVLSTGSGVVLQVDGNTIISGSSRLALTSSGTVTLNTDGNFTYTSSGTSFLATSGTGTLNVDGNFEVSSGTLQGNSMSVVNFSGSSTQTFISGGTFTNVNFDINNGANVNAGTSVFSDGGDFTLGASATLQVGSADADGAIQTGTTAGNIRVSGTRTYNDGATIVYNGAAAQTIGNGFPSSGEINLTIDNASGVTMNGDITLNSSRVLTLTNGNLSIGANTLTLNGTISGTGGISGGASSNLSIGGTGNFGTLTFAGTTTLNDFTLNRTSSGLVTLGGDLSILGTFTQTSGNLDINGNTLEINGAFTQTDGSLLSSGSPTFIISGSGSLPASIAFAAGSFGTFTLDRLGATLTTSASLTITNLNLISGTFNNTGSITMASGGTVTREENGSINNALNATDSYNLIYDIASATSSGPELPGNATDLNNLTKDGAAELTLAVSSDPTINGILTLTSGNLNIGANSVTLEGNLVNNASSMLTSGSFTFSGTTTISGGTDITFGDITVSGTLNLPSDPSNTDVGINGNLVNNGTVTAGNRTTTFGGTTSITGTGTTSLNNVTINGSSTLTFPTGTINVAGNFTNNGTFDAQTGTVDFNGTTSVSGTSNSQFANIVISGTLNGPATLNVNRNFTNNGTFNAGTGTVNFNRNFDPQSVSGSSVTTFNDINVTTATGGTHTVRVNSDQNLQGTLTLGDDVVFDADGTVDPANTDFTLLSTADDGTGDAIIAAIPPTSSVSGNVVVQRFVSGEGRIWRYIAPPVIGATVADWQDDFAIIGDFTGSDPGPGNNASLFFYDETVSGDRNQGWTEHPSTSNTEAVSNEVGYAAFLDEGAAAVTIDVRGTIAQQSIVLNTDYSGPGGMTTDDGWNLFGNPYPAPIDWESVTVSAEVRDFVYVRDNVAGNHKFYDPSMPGMSTLTGGLIAHGQSFWVQATDAGGTVTITESSKASSAEFFETPQTLANVIGITLSDGIQEDISIVRLIDGATAGLDAVFDAIKLDNEIFNISSIVNEDINMLINTLPMDVCGYNVVLNIYNTDPGDYSLYFSELESFETDHNFTLIDNFTNETINIEESPDYAFEITSDPESFGSTRFSLLIEGEVSTNLDISAPASVCEEESVNILINNPQNGISYQVSNGGEVASNTVKGSSTATLSLAVDQEMLVEGVNELTLEAFKEGCEPVSINIPSITIDGIPEIDKIVSTPVCGAGNTILTATGGENAVEFRWFESLEDENPIEGATGNEYTTPEISATRSFFVAAVNATGCEGERIEVTAEVLPEFEIETTVGDSGCAGESLTIAASGAPEGGIYRWFADKDDAEPLSETPAGEFTTGELTGTESFFVSVKSADGCESQRKEITAEIINLETPAIEEEGNVLISSAETGNQWFFNGNPIEGATGNTLEVIESGEYFVQVSAGDNCSATSNTRVVTITGIEDELNEIGLRVYPNPVNNIVFVEFYSEVQKTRLDIVTTTGNIVHRESLKGQNGIFKTEIDISDINSGLYILRVHERERIRYRKLIKK